jgi:hypothetical protein
MNSGFKWERNPSCSCVFISGIPKSSDLKPDISPEKFSANSICFFALSMPASDAKQKHHAPEKLAQKSIHGDAFIYHWALKQSSKMRLLAGLAALDQFPH